MRKLPFALAAAPIGARVKVRTEFDPKVDFTALKVFAWPAAAPGQVKMMLSKDDNPEEIRQHVGADGWAVPAVDRGVGRADVPGHDQLVEGL